MANSFITQIKDDKTWRIVIDKGVREIEDLKKDDFIKVTIEKVKK